MDRIINQIHQYQPWIAGLILLNVVLTVATVFQASQISHGVNSDAYQHGLQVGRNEAAQMLSGLVPVGEAPDTVTDDQGNRHATDGFIYVMLQR